MKYDGNEDLPTFTNLYHMSYRISMKNCNAQEVDISLLPTTRIKSLFPKKSIDEPLYLFVDIKICNGKKVSQKNI